MRRSLALPMAVILAASLAGGALSCGFENPDSVTFQRGVLNLAFPKALYVTTAVWRAQSAGLIDDLSKTPGESGRFGFVNTTLRMNRLGEELGAVFGGEETPSFSVVLVGQMLWTQFRPEGGRLGVFPHVAGPAKGDVVIVTDASVIAAIMDGRITFHDARTLGLVRLYGPPPGVAVLTDRLDAIESVVKQSHLAN